MILELIRPVNHNPDICQKLIIWFDKGLIVKCNNGLKTLLQEGISEPIFHWDLVYKIKTNR